MPFHLVPESRSGATPITRRGFLAGASALALGGIVGAGASDGAPWYALLADTHIAGDEAVTTRGQVMADNLRRALDDVLAQRGRPAGLFVDGDLALRDGQLGDYQTFLRLLDPVRQAQVPIHLTLGNHDDRAHMREVVRGVLPPAPAASPSDKLVSVVEGPGLRFLLLDSLMVPNSTPGRLGQPQLDWLAATLDAKPDVPAITFVHHNPALGLTSLLDTEALLAVLRPRRQAKALVFGHTHVWDYRTDDGLYLINLPAVAYPFSADQPIGWCLLRPEPGGATLQLRCHGGDRKADRLTVELTWRGL